MRLRGPASICFVVFLVICANQLALAAGHPPTALSENSNCNEGVFYGALNEIRRKGYQQGRAQLRCLVGRECSISPAALLVIADSFYREGGSLALATAEGEYVRWLELFPEHELAPLVIKKTAEVHLRQLNARNGESHAALANQTLLRLQQLYPQSSSDPTVQEYHRITEELIAEHQLKIARFYLDVRSSAELAKTRCLQIVEKFPLFTRMDAALWYLAQACELLAQTDETESNINEALTSYVRIVRQHNNSGYRDKAIERLRYYGRDVPNPDPDFNVGALERAANLHGILSDIDAYALGISRKGVLLNDDDEVDRNALKLVLKGDASNAIKPTNN